MSLLQYRKVTLTTPSRREEGRFRLTSMYNFSGCEGAVYPGILNINGEKKRIQVKRFYRESFDDRGEQFSQNPEEKVKESYEALRQMQKLGFKVLPFFGKLRAHGLGTVLAMYDLTEGNTLEVYDGKSIARNKEQQVVINGKTKMKNARNAITGLSNYQEIQIGLEKQRLLQTMHMISHGFCGAGEGTQCIFTRNPTTNQGDFFIVDVGQYERRETKYSKALDLERRLIIPEEEIIQTLDKMLFRAGHKVKAGKLYSEFSERFSKKREFLNLLYQAMIGLSMYEHLGGWIGKDEFAKELFPRNKFSNDLLKIKFSFLQSRMRISELIGEGIYDFSKENVSRFLSPQTPKDTMLGIEFSQLAHLDNQLRLITQSKKALDNNTAIPEKKPKILHAPNGIPRTVLFENPNEPIRERMEITIRDKPIGRDDAEMDVEVDWQTAYNHRISAGTDYMTISKESIRRARINGIPIPNFDPEKVEVTTSAGSIWYFYEEQCLARLINPAILKED
ncbi:MAG: hypothetical protein AABW80_05490 [Nanoarchaeota archaeon]